MEPLIDQFTKNLPGCSGCGTNGEYEMKYQITITVDADSAVAAVQKAETIGELVSLQIRSQSTQQVRPTLPIQGIPRP